MTPTLGRPLRPVALLLVLGLLGPLAMFASLAEEVSDGERLSWDVGALALLRTLISRADAVAAASWLGVGILVATAVVLAGSVIRRSPGDAVYWLVTMSGVAVLAPVVKDAFDRPPVTFHGGGFTFPSGSAMAMTALVAGLGFLVPRVRWLVVCLGALAGAVAGAMLVASHEYRASDVLGGWVLGLAWATAVWATTSALRTRSHAPPGTVASRRARDHTAARPSRRGRFIAPGRANTVKVIYIAGPARAGSTLLDLLLSRLVGATSVGELQYVWTRGLLADDPCGCGCRFAECPFWRAVGRTAFDGWDKVDVDHVVGLQHRVARLRHWPWLLGSRLRPGFQQDAAELAGYVERLYLAIAAVSGRSIVVDSSKAPVPMLLLGRMRRIDGRVLHLVRDSRGVAYSWEKRVRRLPDRDEYMDTFAPARSALGWLALTIPPHLARSAGLRRRLVRYESLLDRPQEELGGILAFADVAVSGEALAQLERGPLDFGTNHIVSGNPLRFRREPRPLAIDVEWRTAMGRKDRLIVSLLTWPLQAAYGYSWPRRPRKG
jgi:membrane-associated phospholipid phosphatase